MNWRVGLFPSLLILNACSDDTLTCKDLGSNYLKVISKVKTTNDSVRFVKKLEDLVEIYSRCVKAKELLAECYLGAGLIHEALGLYRLNIEQDSSALFSFYNLSELYRMQGKNDSALICIVRAVEIKETDRDSSDFNDLFSTSFDVKYVDLLLSRAIVLYELKKYDLASVDFQRVLQKGYEEYLCRSYLREIEQKKSATNAAK
jgi:tetratricopeptide (TPR) repeat protein